MKKCEFEKVDEHLYEETLDNGIKVYLYDTKNAKNFYISISVKYGARVTKYKTKDKIVNVIPGSAHFLEHKVMALSENKEISKRINDFGSLANAWTNYYGTNYNIFGSINILENLNLLLDIFYNTDINEKCVNEEKGIIGEEIDMYKDQLNYYMYHQLFNNLFEKSFIKNGVVGERSDIEKITASSLNEIYNDFYVPNNTFITVCGDFDPKEVLDFIKKYMSKLNLKQKELPEIITEHEKSNVLKEFEIVNKDTEDYRVKYALKIPRSNFKIKNDTFLKYYLNMILGSNFTASAELFENYRTKGIIISMSTTVHTVDDYVVIVINSVCKDDKKFIDNISKDIKKLKINEEDFERKKKLFLKSYILDFENIEDVEYNICDSILMDGCVNYNEYSDIKNMSFKEAQDILSSISYDNVSIIKTKK